MAQSVKIASLSELQPGTGKSVEVGGCEIAVFNVNGEVCAIDNTCVHRGGPLGDGYLDGNVVTCPWHAWEYDVKSGACLTQEGVTQKVYPVTIEGDEVRVTLE